MAVEQELRFIIRTDNRAGRAALQATAKDLKGVGDQSERTSRKGTTAAQAMEKGWTQVRNIAVGVGLTFGAMEIANIVRQWTASTIQFQKEMATVGTLLNTATGATSVMRREILSLSGNLGSATELTRALYLALSSGIKPAEGVQFVADAARLAKSAVIDAALAVDVLTTILNAYGMEASKAGEVSDKFREIIDQGKAEADDLAASLGRVIPTAALLGISLDEVGAAIATMTLGGISAEEATTALNQALLSFLSPSVEARKLAKAMGIELNGTSLQSKGLFTSLLELSEATAGNSEATATFFGNVRALKAVLALTGPQASSFERILVEMEKAAGNTNSAFKLQNDTIDNQLSASWNNMNRIFSATAGEGTGLTIILRGVNASLDLQAKSMVRVGAPQKTYIDGTHATNLLLREQMELLPKVGRATERLAQDQRRAFDDLIERTRKFMLSTGQMADKTSESNEKMNLAFRDTLALASRMEETGLSETMKENNEQFAVLNNLLMMSNPLLKELGIATDQYGTAVQNVGANAINAIPAIKGLIAANQDNREAIEGWSTGEVPQNVKAFAQNFDDNRIAAKSFADVMKNQVSTIFTDLSKGIAESIVKWKGMWDTMKRVAEQFAVAILRAIIEKLLAPLAAKLLGLGGTFKQSLSGAGGGGATAGGFGIPGVGGIGLAGTAGLGMAAGGAVLGGKFLGGISGAMIGGGAGLGGAAMLGLLGSMGPIGGMIAGGLLAVGGITKLIQALGPERGFKGGAVDLVRDLGVEFKNTDKALKDFATSLGLSEKQFDGLRVDIGRSPAFFQKFLLPAAEATGQVDELVKSFSRLEVSAAVGASVQGLTKSFDAQGDVIFDLRKQVQAAIQGDFDPLNEAFMNIFKNSKALTGALGGIPNSLLGITTAAKDATEAINSIPRSISVTIEETVRRRAADDTRTNVFATPGFQPPDFKALFSDIMGLIVGPGGLEALRGKMTAFGGIREATTREIFEGRGIPFQGTRAIGSVGLAQQINDLIEKINTLLTPFLNSSILREQFGIDELLGRIGQPITLKPMKHGAIVRKATPALVGEAGPEAVIPLSKMTPSVIVNIEGPIYGIDDLDRKIAESFTRTMSRGGFSQTLKTLNQ